MAPVVVLALSLMVVALGATAVAALQLRRAAKALADGVKVTMDRVQPLTAELQEGAEVAAAEAEALQRRLERIQADRQTRKRPRG
jgi:hypothetical protein